MSELFDIPQSLSPKLAFLQKHDLVTHEASDVPNIWICRNRAHTRAAFGEDEDTAILDFCERHNLKHWTLEDGANS